jgi:hypothetical protein
MHFRRVLNAVSSLDPESGSWPQSVVQVIEVLCYPNPNPPSLVTIIFVPFVNKSVNLSPVMETETFPIQVIASIGMKNVRGKTWVRRCPSGAEI